MSANENENYDQRTSVNSAALASKLLFVGFAIIFLGILVSAFGTFFSAPFNGEISGGAMIFIGPFPIVFGVGPNASILIFLGLLIALMMFIFIIFTRRGVM